jgi:hypothetical protein
MPAAGRFTRDTWGMSEPTTYLLIGGPAHGEELILRGQPETYDVDGEMYLRTVAAGAAFYRHSSLLPESAIDAYLWAIGSIDSNSDIQ